MVELAAGHSEDPIGVFDSGVGGLTVVRALMERLPFENIIYFGDTARVPYGIKSVEVISHYARQITEFLLHQRVKLLIIACNTMNVVVANNIFENVRDYGIDNETADNTNPFFRCLAIGNRFTFDPTADASSTAYYANSRKGNIALFNTFEDYAGHQAISTPESADLFLNATGNYWGEGAEGSGIDAACQYCEARGLCRKGMWNAKETVA